MTLQFCKPLGERTIAARRINPTAFDYKLIGACISAAEKNIISIMTSQSNDDVIISVFLTLQSWKPLGERTIAARKINQTLFDHKSIGACTHTAEKTIIPIKWAWSREFYDVTWLNGHFFVMRITLLLHGIERWERVQRITGVDDIVNE